MQSRDGNNSIEEKIELLNRKYEEALQNGVEFSVLREIKDKLKLLKDQLGSDGEVEEEN